MARNGTGGNLRCVFVSSLFSNRVCLMNCGNNSLSTTSILLTVTVGKPSQRFFKPYDKKYTIKMIVVQTFFSNFAKLFRNCEKK
jgi:hypothetical protein